MTERLKQCLVDGKIVTMVNLNYPAPGLVETLGRLGFDAVMLDCEKGSYGMERIEEAARAGRAAGIATVVRPWLNDPGLISRYLDVGATGIMAAGLDTAGQASAIVEAVRYARHQDFATKLIIGMIETPQAVERLPDLLAVAGIDVWVIGANDMAHRMGRPGGARHPEVQQMIHRAIATIVERGKVCGMTLNAGNAEELLGRGVRYVNTNVNALLGQAASGFLAMLRRGH